MFNFLKLLWRQKVAVIILILLVNAGYFGYYAAFSGQVRGNVQGAIKGKDWTTTRFDLRRRGVVPGTASPTQALPVKSGRIDSEFYFSSPAVVGNRVYIATGKINAPFPSTGQILWPGCQHPGIGLGIEIPLPPDVFLPRHFRRRTRLRRGPAHHARTPRWSASIFGPAMKANCSGI